MEESQDISIQSLSDSQTEKDKWYINDVGDEEIDYTFKDYDVTSSPNDFNTKTIIDFIESGLFRIPGFQRNYVWDIKRASKLIESVIIGLPIPQVYLYEEGKNMYLVVDGQQRLLTLYFFQKKKFPNSKKRFELRQIFDEHGKFPNEYLDNSDYFIDFKLDLPKENKLSKLNYSTLGEHRPSFDFRTIRNIMIKQNFPENDDSAMFEIFNRLNSGGVVLKPQEIRTSLYHSDFYKELYKLNLLPSWRIILNQPEPDLHMKDIEIMLRGFAMLLNGENYTAPMTNFLNIFSKKTKQFQYNALLYFRQIFTNFCQEIVSKGENIFLSKTGKFSITIFESVFVALCENSIKLESLEIKELSLEKLEHLKSNEEFIKSTQENTASKKHVESRLTIAKLSL